MPADGMGATGSPERRFGTPVSVARHRAYASFLTMAISSFRCAQNFTGIGARFICCGALGSRCQCLSRVNNRRAGRRPVRQLDLKQRTRKRSDGATVSGHSVILRCNRVAVIAQHRACRRGPTASSASYKGRQADDCKLHRASRPYQQERSAVLAAAALEMYVGQWVRLLV